MITFGSLSRLGSVHRRCYRWSVALMGCPQVRGRLLRLFTTTPRNPNSARRRVGNIRLTNGNHIIAKLPGKGNHPGNHAVILVRGHGFKDTPGVGYSMISGALECLSLFNNRRRRSIYGANNS